MPREDKLFEIIERINDSIYKVDLPGKHNISITFNVCDLSLFDVGNDSRSNCFNK